jgi:hypothetical protein
MTTILGRYSAQIVLMMLGTLSLTWFRGHIIDSGDFGLPLNRLDYFHATLNVWDSRWSFGALMPAQVTALPLATLAASTQVLGLPLLWYESLTFYIWFAGSGLSAYYMCRTFGLTSRVSLFAGAFYMLNPFSLVIIWQVGQGLLQVPYMTAPLALACYNDYVVRGNLKKFVAIMLAWVGIGGTIAFVNPDYIVIVLIPIALLFGTRFIDYLIERQDKEAFQQLVVRTMKIMGVFVLANLFWIIPVLSTLGEQFSSFASLQLAFGSLYHAYSLGSANLVDSTRLFGYWALSQSAFYGPYYSWGATYSAFPFVGISLLIPVLTGIALMGRVSRRKLYFATVAIASLVLITGTNPPFGPLNVLLFEKITFFQAFDEAFERFGILVALSFTPLVAEGLARFYRIGMRQFPAKVAHKTVKQALPKIAAGCIALLLLVMLVFPFWTGEVVQPSAVSSLSPRVDVPSDYYQLRNFTNNLPFDDRVISLPLSTSYNIALDWPDGGYIGSDPTIWFSSVPVVMVDQNAFTELLRIGQLGTYGAQDFSRLLSIAGVNYIIYHGDANFTLLEGSAQSGELFSQRLNATLSQFQAVTHYGDLTVYSNQYSPYPLIYSPQDFFVGNLTSQSIEDLVQVTAPSSMIGTMTCNLTDDACNQAGAGYIEPFDDPGQAFYVPTEGVYSVNELADTPLSNMSSAHIWQQDLPVSDSFSVDGSVHDGPVQFLNWTIDRKISGLRGIGFQVPSNMIENLTQFYVWVKGDGSGNTLIIQIYDQSQNYIAFPQTIDWTGWKHLLVQVGYPSYSNNITGFNPSEISSITYYYDNSNLANSNSTVVIGPPESLEWQTSDYTSLSQGVYASNSTIDTVVLQNRDGLQAPQLSYSRIGTNRYLVDVSNATESFPLIFSQSFDPGWQACFGDLSEVQDFYSQCLPVAEHFVANDYANGWTINKLGSFQLTILYSGDSVYHISLAVSISSWILMAAVTVFVVMREKRVRKKRGLSRPTIHAPFDSIL